MTMESNVILDFTQRGLLLAVWVCLPVVIVAASVGLLVAVVQATTQLQDQTLSQVLKLLAAAMALVICAQWMGSSIFFFVDDLLRASGF